MKVKYFIIIALFGYLLAAIIVACPTPQEIRYAREDREERIRQSNETKEDKAYFEKLTEYCREHEDLYMEILEQIFGYLDERLSVDEACAAMENTAGKEQRKILAQTSLSYPYEGNFAELSGNAIYYNYKGSYINIKAVYIHECSKEVEEFIASIEYTKIEKINDHLYVFYTNIPYT